MLSFATLLSLSHFPFFIYLENCIDCPRTSKTYPNVRGDLVLSYYQKKIFKAKKRTIMNKLLFVKGITKMVFLYLKLKLVYIEKS